MGVLTAEIFEGFDGEFLWMDSLGPLPPEQRNSKSSDMELKDRRLASMAAHLSALQWLDHDGEIEVIEKASVISPPRASAKSFRTSLAAGRLAGFFLSCPRTSFVAKLEKTRSAAKLNRQKLNRVEFMFVSPGFD